MNEIIRVGIYTDDGNFPFKINKSKSLKENILDICKEANLPAGESYGLKLIAKEKLVNRESSEYVDNLSSIIDGSALELVPSVDIVVKFTFGDPRINFEDLAKYNTDTVFIRCLAQYGHSDTIQNCITQKLNDVEMSITLVTLLQLLKHSCVQTLYTDVVAKLIDMIKHANIITLKQNYAQSQYIPSVVEHAMSVLCQILFSKYEDHKQKIMKSLNISDLLQFCIVWNVNFQVKLLRLVNTMVRCVKKDQRYTLLETLDSKKNKQCIYDNIINSENEITNAMAHELAVYQSYILSLFKNTLDTYVDERHVPRQAETDINRLSNMLDFQESLNHPQMWSSMESLPHHNVDRYSFVSHASRDSICTNQTLSLHSECSAGESYCYLTNECLEHYEKEHPLNFGQSTLEESAYQVNITYTAERVTRMLANILGIGDPPPRKQTDNYHPIVFDTNVHNNFFLELFSRTMWLLSKTRKEMKARTAEDFFKVIYVLERQVMMVLEKKPLNLKQVLEHMKGINYKMISEQLDKERDINWRNILKTNPCIQEMMDEYRKINSKLIYEQRMGVLKKGLTFPKRIEKKTTLSIKNTNNAPQYMHVQLCENLKNFKIYSCDDLNTKRANHDHIHPVATIRHVITGRNCPHFKDHSNKQEKLLFTLQLEGDVNINFVTPDVKTSNYWIDGFNLLLGKDNRSEDYHKDLETLTEMDIALQIMELQETTIPNEPPPIPPLPKPTVPPKTSHHLARNRISHANKDRPPIPPK
ncbi:PH domain [Popillia japonica]|uniref:PH domain n=1 Tax=Popillia japonica TaxID=7064 RepID=A0AAW1IUN6_POPJA